MKIIKRSIYFLLSLIGITLIVSLIFGPAFLEKHFNKTLPYTPPTISADAKKLHASLTVMDWHADTLLWNRDFLEKSDYGQVDMPRLREGNISIQMLTTVTKSPSGQNINSNAADTHDNITSLALLQAWPPRTWNSLLERALYQAEKLETYVKSANGGLNWVKNKPEFENYLAGDRKALAVLLGSEGAHPLEGDIINVDRMYNAGFRMIGLTHFFDNELGGSLHGESNAGLTPFGKDVVKRLDTLNVIIDLAHASEQMAYDVLALSTRPPVVSHTGLKGACNTKRNFPDTLMQAIAQKGGLIAIGMWETAVCDPTPEGIARSIIYGINLVGADHISLGSDWDGSVEAISANLIPHITAELLKAGVSEQDIRKVMGENSIRFLQQWLPD